jgi:hypothetical protein
MIQAMICGVVYTSGAGMSFSGPMMARMALAYRRDRRSSSPSERFFGLQVTPPLPPP